MMDTTTYLALLLAGFVIVFIGILIIFLSLVSHGRGKVEGGGVVIIGPIPIIFGSSQKISILLVILAIILTVLVLLMYIVPLFIR